MIIVIITISFGDFVRSGRFISDVHGRLFWLYFYLNFRQSNFTCCSGWKCNFHLFLSTYDKNIWHGYFAEYTNRAARSY